MGPNTSRDCPLHLSGVFKASGASDPILNVKGRRRFGLVGEETMELLRETPAEFDNDGGVVPEVCFLHQLPEAVDVEVYGLGRALVVPVGLEFDQGGFRLGNREEFALKRLKE